MDNLSRLRAAMEQSSVPALLVTTIQNVRWLSGFTGSSAVCLVTPGTAVLVTDSRYTLQARAEVQGLEVVVFQNPRSLDDVIEEQAAAAGASKIGFESSLTYGQWKKRRDRISAVEWVESPDLIRDLRMVKTADEVKRIKAACQLADACIENITRLIQVGRTEHEIGLDIEFFYRRHGAGIAFDPIVASGPNSAKPHAHPGERRIARGDFVTIDCGGRLDGYCSDITRTFVAGEASDRHREIYDLVLKAEVECCALLQPGAQGKEVDGHARKLFAEKGLDHHFGHGLGHGLGIDVHDPGGLSPTVDQPIAEGMVFTVEPGIYIEGFGGVRIEDDVLVTAAGPEILTHAPKELLIL
ncbi:MAG: aminopeptidase P family protein [Armatimonadetes bacterium]|nr:aminopeptidase P family protein [Armatimonadota bacterium]MBX3107995.1 aminopeptidase P family protein [Fimbriimonadaceae bacterium]